MYAVQALNSLINQEQFDIRLLASPAMAAVEALCLLARELDESDSKITVLELAGDIIRLLSVQQSALCSLVVPLAGYLESLWSETDPTDLSRNAILTVSSNV
jgi:hypothetical protein